MKKKPNGYVATCQCGIDVGAIDLERTEKRDAGKILGDWISEGCKLTPQFNGNWEVKISVCECNLNK